MDSLTPGKEDRNADPDVRTVRGERLNQSDVFTSAQEPDGQ